MSSKYYSKIKNKKRCIRYNAEWVHSHPEYIQEWQKQVYKRNRRFINRVALWFGCAQCGYKKCSQALEFHHIDKLSKTFAVSMCGGYSIKRLKEEIRKCIVLCSNCHRCLHQAEQPIIVPCMEKYWQFTYVARKSFIDRVVLRFGCKACGYKEHAAALDFHHCDPTVKRFSVRARTISAIETLKTEMRKCDILCANCHAELDCNSEVCKHERV